MGGYGLLGAISSLVGNVVRAKRSEQNQEDQYLQWDSNILSSVWANKNNPAPIRQRAYQLWQETVEGHGKQGKELVGQVDEFLQQQALPSIWGINRQATGAAPVGQPQPATPASLVGGGSQQGGLGLQTPQTMNYGPAFPPQQQPQQAQPQQPPLVPSGRVNDAPQPRRVMLPGGQVVTVQPGQPIPAAVPATPASLVGATPRQPQRPGALRALAGIGGGLEEAFTGVPARDRTRGYPRLMDPNLFMTPEQRATQESEVEAARIKADVDSFKKTMEALGKDAPDADTQKEMLENIITKKYGGTGTLTGRVHGVAGVTPGTDVTLQTDAARLGIPLDPKKWYREEEDASGRVTRIREAPGPQSQLAAQMKSLYEANKATGMSDEQAMKEAGDYIRQNFLLGMEKKKQDIFIDSLLAGLQTPAVTSPAAAAPATSPASQQPAPGETPAAPDTAPPSTRVAPFVQPKKSGGWELNDRGKIQANLLAQSLIPGAGGSARSKQMLAGKALIIPAIAKVTGKSDAEVNADMSDYHGELKASQDAAVWYGNLLRITNQIDQSGMLFLDAAKALNQVSPAILNSAWQAWQQNMTTGNPELDKYLLALNQLDRVYSVMTAGAPASRGMPPVDTTNHIRQLLRSNMTMKDAVAMVQQIGKEKGAEVRAYYGQASDLRNLIMSNSLSQALGGPNVPSALTPPPETSGTSGAAAGGTADDAAKAKEFLDKHPEFLKKKQ
jgi:hypothetical protein